MTHDSELDYNYFRVDLIKGGTQLYYINTFSFYK